MFLSDVLNAIATHPQAAYFFIFLISLSESLAFVGLLIPGTVLMLGVGAVIATGSLSLKPTLIVAMAGAVAGDGISYCLGRYYRERLSSFWPFKHRPGMLSRGKAFFHQHGGKSILFGRFVGPVRPIIPIVAGMLDMPPLKFAFVNTLSAIGWAFAYVIPGVFFGTSLTMAGRVSARLAILFLLLAATVWVFVWLCRKLLVLIGQLGPRWLLSLETWIASDTPAHGVSSSLKRFLSFLFFRQSGEELLFAFLLLVVFLTGWGFLALLQDVVMRDTLVRTDQAVYHFFQSLRNPWGDRLFVIITELGDRLINYCVVVVVFLTLVLKRCYRAAGYWLATVIGGACLVWFLKWTLHSPRPVVLYHGIPAFGFPSGHTTMNVVIYGFLAVLLTRGLQKSLQLGIFAFVFLVSFAVSFSRLYLGVHWPSDVLGGFLLALALIALTSIFYIKGSGEVIPRRLLGLATMVVFLTVGSWHVVDRHREDLAFYAPRHTVQLISLRTWLESGWNGIPAWRIDLGGDQEQPLTVQWAGSPGALAEYLVSNGWHSAPALNLKAFLGTLSPKTPIGDLPLFPHLHDGRFEEVLLVREEGNKRWVFHLWPTDVQLMETGEPLWVGTVETQIPHRIVDFITLAKDKGDYIEPLKSLAQTLRRGDWVVEMRQRIEKRPGRGKRDYLQWNGQVLLATT